ncbi:hypothetical protein [Paracoccus binzhouensis]|uniref:hypothetical protein n=1 Tax=Paracoccus binzhouensis TaxID=2796149 RepID=UPI0018EEF7C5|nr:hypothetical protein [Paracoccus binzhouensis]
MTSQDDFHAFSIEAIMDEPKLTILRGVPANPTADPMVVCFGSWGPKGRPPEFRHALAAMRRKTLFVLEQDFGYYSRPRRVERIFPIIAAEMTRQGTEVVDIMEFSIEAFEAISWASILPVRHTMAFAPRWSPDPAIVRDPRVRKEMVESSGSLRFPTAKEGSRKIKGGMLLHGLNGPDPLHIPCFLRAFHLDHWVAPQGNHFMPAWLRNQHMLIPVVRAVLNGERKVYNSLMKKLQAKKSRSLSMLYRLAHLRITAPNPGLDKGEIA